MDVPLFMGEWGEEEWYTALYFGYLAVEKYDKKQKEVKKNCKREILNRNMFE